MKPLLSYYGGKQRIASKILPYIEAIPHSIYCEPFCGGSSLLFAKPKPILNNDHFYREVINDTNKLLVTLYQVCQTQKDEFLHLINYTPYSEAEHRKAKEICNNFAEYDDLWIAWAIYVNIMQGFSHKQNAGWKRSCYSQNFAATWNNRKSNLPAVLDRLSKVHISCSDALKCIKNWDCPDTLFYLDPPYVNTEQGHYKGYTESDFKQLLDLLKLIDGSFVLSCYSNHLIPKEWQKVEIPAVMSAKKMVKGEKRENNKRTECLWIVNKHANTLTDLPLFASQKNDNFKTTTTISDLEQIKC